MGDDGHVLGGGRVLGAIDVVGGEVVGEPDQGVLEGGKSLGASPPVAVPLKLAPGFPPRLIDKQPQALDERRTERRILPGIGAGKLRGLLAERVEIEIRRGFDDCLVHGRREF